MLYRKMRHHWCNFALIEECRVSFFNAQNGCATTIYLCIEILKTSEYEDNRRA